jgi:NAD-dependent deacetylase
MPVGDDAGLAAGTADAVAATLAGARTVVAVTGAGMSQESGVPTFRDAQTGLWARFDPAELATPEAFRRDPERVFGWYLRRWTLARRAEPHAGYRALAGLADVFDELLVVTQNVDGLHRRAGSPDVVELHGSLEAFRCADAGHPFAADGLEALAGRVPDGPVAPPRCPVCGSPVRPGVVWFGEGLPGAAVERAWAAAESCDAMLVIGTSSLVFPAASVPEIVLRRGRPVIEINPDRTPLTPRARVWWPARAGDALPALAARLHAA